MIPFAFVPLAEMPLTVSGKLDRNSLPEPEALAPALGEECEPPIGFIEHAVSKIWQDLLGLSEIGRHDNFFELGGHSLLATAIIARTQLLLSIEIPITSLFLTSTIASYAACCADIYNQSRNSGEAVG